MVKEIMNEIKQYRCFIGILVLLVTSRTFAQSSDLKFMLLSQTDDFEQFKNMEQDNFYRKLKYSNLGDSAAISFGGNYRIQWEMLDNPMFQKEDGLDNNWFLSRGMFHADMRLSNRWQVFGELGTSHSVAKDMPSPVDEDRLHVNQLFGKYRTENYEIAIGRENFNYGSRRLIAIREGPNVRLSFDAIRFTYKWEQFSSEALLLSNVANEIGVLDNDFYAFDDYIWGSYNRFQNRKNTTKLELYYFGYRAEMENYASVNGEETRHSVGFRSDISLAGWKFNNEFVYQFGSINNQNIDAWTLSINGKYQISEHFDYEFNGEIISGDRNAGDGQLNTFNPLYPDAAYFGRVARIGPYNLIDLHTNVVYKNTQFTSELGYYAFWRYSNEDAVYSSGGRPIYLPVNDEKFVAHQLGLNIKYYWNSHFETDLESNMILPGNFIKAQGFSDNIYYILLTSKFTF